jgi:hypothetical protein
LGGFGMLPSKARTTWPTFSPRACWEIFFSRIRVTGNKNSPKDRFFPAHRFFRSNVVFVGFGFPYSYYPYSYYPDDPYLNNDYEPNYDEQDYDYRYWNESAQPAQSEFMRRGNYNAPIEGISSFGNH